MPETDAWAPPTVDEIREAIEHAVEVLEPDAARKAEAAEALKDLRENFPGVGNENLLRFAHYVFELSHRLWDVTGDQVVWSMSAGFAVIAAELLKDIA